MLKHICQVCVWDQSYPCSRFLLFWDVDCTFIPFWAFHAFQHLRVQPMVFEGFANFAHLAVGLKENLYSLYQCSPLLWAPFSQTRSVPFPGGPQHRDSTWEPPRRPDVQALVFHQNANNIICNIQSNIIVVLIGEKEIVDGSTCPLHYSIIFNYNGCNKREQIV